MVIDCYITYFNTALERYKNRAYVLIVKNALPPIQSLGFDGMDLFPQRVYPCDFQ